MTDDRYSGLLDFIHSRAGNAVRAAVRYDADDWTVLYVREDVATPELREALPALMERAREYEPVVRGDAYGTIGETQATVELHQRAALIHFSLSPSDGVVVSLDRDVTQGLGQFINQCNSVLDED